MQGKQRSNWDYFCELLVAIPGLAAVFEDVRPDGTGEATYKKVRETEDRLHGRAYACQRVRPEMQ